MARRFLSYPETVKLAWSVRQKCLKFAMSDESIGYDFHNDGSLACMCAVSSMALRKASEDRLDLIKGIYKREGEHCWNRYGPWIFDVTASQFGVSIPVLVIRTENGHKKYSKGRVSNRYKDFRWGSSQNPTPQLIKQILTERY
jgi:hypothetical protein